MNNVIKLFLLASLGFMVFLFAGCSAFFYFFDTQLHIKNDTATNVQLVLLLENSDNPSLHYLSKQLQIKPGEVLVESIGWESVPCIYINSENKEHASKIDLTSFPRTNRDSAPIKIQMNISAIMKNTERCPWDKTKFKEGSY